MPLFLKSSAYIADVLASHAIDWANGDDNQVIFTCPIVYILSSYYGVLLICSYNYAHKGCIFSFVSCLLGYKCWQVQCHCFLTEWLHCRQKETGINYSDYVRHHRYCRLQLWVHKTVTSAAISKCAYTYICRPVGEMTLMVDGGSVRLNFWDTCGQEKVSLIWSSHLASFMCMCRSSSILVYTSSFVR